MIYPLSWLEEYTKLPKSVDILTDRLTMIGHMLDKKSKVGTEELIDLELRGNRPDLLGVYGMAREISLAFDSKLDLLKLTKLPKTDPKSDLVSIKDPDLVERFMALTLKVKVKPSPEWLKKRLACFGVPSINNVVDITNYVMLETGEPMHSFDLERLTGKKLILRRARNHEQMNTIQGNIVNLEPDDLVLSDLKKPQGLTIIGSRDSGTIADTKEILLEAAVYKYGNVRKTARRLGIHTDAGTRHEKILDPNQVEIALERALTLLKDLAQAETTSEVFDFYPNKQTPIEISISEKEVKQITSLDVSQKEIASIMEHLGGKVEISKDKDHLNVLAPTFRTDLIQTADLVEEVARIIGYEKIPEKALTTYLPNQIKFPLVRLEEEIKDILVNFGFKETVNLSIIPETDLKAFSKGGTYPKAINLLNPPDPKIATLRPSLLPGLFRTIIKAANFKQDNLSYFEVGKVFFEDPKERKIEQDRVAFIKPLGKQADQITYSKLVGVLESLMKNLGVDYSLSKTTHVAGLGPIVAEIQDSLRKPIGFVGLVNPEISNSLKLGDIFVCELTIDKIVLPEKNPYSSYFLYPPFPAIYEDITVEVTKDSDLAEFLKESSTISPLIKNIKLVSIFNKSRTFRISYQDEAKSISSAEVKPLREKILKLVTKHKLTTRE